MKKTLFIILSFAYLILPFQLWSSELPSLDIASFQSEPAFKLAAIHWLPDFLKANLDNNHRSLKDNGGTDIIPSCSIYNPDFLTSVPPNMVCESVSPAQGLTCYQNCHCENRFRFSSSNCTDGYYLSGEVCGGQYSECLSFPCSHQGYETSVVAEMKCVPVTYGDNTCYRCSDPCAGLTDNSGQEDCVNYGCQIKYNDDCPYCQTCNSDNCGKYSDKVLATSCTDGCAQNKSLADCPSRCTLGCRANCSNGYYLSADELNCLFDPCQKFSSLPLVSSCPAGCALGQTADGCSSRCAVGCKAVCAVPSELTSDQLSCQCPAQYSCDGSDPAKICYGSTCGGKKSTYLDLNNPLQLLDDLFYTAGFHLSDSDIFAEVDTVTNFSFRLYGKSYYYQLVYPDFSIEEKKHPEVIVTQCPELIFALKDPLATNIRISGHIVCTDTDTQKLDWYHPVENKFIYGLDRKSDIIDSSIPLFSNPYKSRLLKFKDLTLKINSTEKFLTTVLLYLITLRSYHHICPGCPEVLISLKTKSVFILWMTIRDLAGTGKVLF